MSYIGNKPSIEIVQESLDNFDYIVVGVPTTSINPTILYATYLNVTTGEVCVCTDNTTDANVWKSCVGS